MEIGEIFRGNMRKRRKEMGLTQEELAERADWSFTFISQIERGEKEPSLRTAYKISQALKTPLEPSLEVWSKQITFLLFSLISFFPFSL